jgi:hypothetical protein
VARASWLQCGSHGQSRGSLGPLRPHWPAALLTQCQLVAAPWYLGRAHSQTQAASEPGEPQWGPSATSSCPSPGACSAGARLQRPA